MSVILPADTNLLHAIIAALIALVLGCIIALLPTCRKWAIGKLRAREPLQNDRKPITWRIRGIPNNVNEECLREKLKGSFGKSSQESSILKLSLASLSPEYRCATVTSTSPPLSCDDERWAVDMEFLGITPLSQPDPAAAHGIVE